MPLLTTGAGKFPALAAAGFTLVANEVSTGAAFLGPRTTPAINTTGANLLVLSVSQYAGNTIGVVSDSKGNTWTGLTAQTTAGSQYTRIYYTVPTSVGSGHTFTFDTSPGGGALNGIVGVQAWSGGHASPFDQESGATVLNTATIQPGSLTPSQANSLIITSLSVGSGGTGYSINSSYIITANADVGTGPDNQGFAMAYLLQGAAAATNPTWTIASGVNSPATVMAVFKPA